MPRIWFAFVDWVALSQHRFVASACSSLSHWKSGLKSGFAVFSSGRSFQGVAIGLMTRARWHG
ncbi:hypothetical protein ColKHC_12067 [Colletotrichum higginsianum]|nr:hypothetical protein ColKHC_12067 [Colletotrichum higginsianum]